MRPLLNIIDALPRKNQRITDETALAAVTNDWWIVI